MQQRRLSAPLGGRTQALAGGRRVTCAPGRSSSRAAGPSRDVLARQARCRGRKQGSQEPDRPGRPKDRPKDRSAAAAAAAGRSVDTHHVVWQAWRIRLLADCQPAGPRLLPARPRGYVACCPDRCCWWRDAGARMDGPRAGWLGLTQAGAGECKPWITKYMACLQENKATTQECRQFSKGYLQCRMDKCVLTPPLRCVCVCSAHLLLTPARTYPHPCQRADGQGRHAQPRVPRPRQPAAIQYCSCSCPCSCFCTGTGGRRPGAVITAR